MSIEKFGENVENNGDSPKEGSAEINEKQTSNLEKSPQIAKSWRYFWKGLKMIEDVKKIESTIDSIHENTMEGGGEMATLSMELEDPLSKLLEAANKREEQIKKQLAEELLHEYGEKIGFKIHEDGTLELTNGLKYGSDTNS